MAKKKKASSPEETLRAELIGMLKQINAEGLTYLIDQTHILLHNLQVDKVNQEMRKLQVIDSKAQKANGRQRDGSGNPAGPDGPEPGRSEVVDIEEAEGGKHFILLLNASRKFFTLEELRALALVCQAAEPEEAGSRLYRWFAKNRNDVLTDAKILAGDPILNAVYELIRSRYKTRS